MEGRRSQCADEDVVAALRRMGVSKWCALCLALCLEGAAEAKDTLPDAASLTYGNSNALLLYTSKLEARKEARARWDEGRVGGWR